MDGGLGVSHMNMAAIMMCHIIAINMYSSGWDFINQWQNERRHNSGTKWHKVLRAIYEVTDIKRDNLVTDKEIYMKTLLARCSFEIMLMLHFKLHLSYTYLVYYIM